MATKRGKRLNGSVNAFANSLREMIKEATAEAVEPIQGSQDALLDEMVDMEDRLTKNINKNTTTVAKNTQSQLAEVNKRLGKLEKRL